MLFLLIRSIHILAAIWFTCGVAAYLFTRRAALGAEDVRGVDALVQLMGRFKNFMIRPGAALLLIFGLWAAYDEGWPHFALHAIALLVILLPFVILVVRGNNKLEAACAEAMKSVTLTPELKAALRDRMLVIGDIGIGTITVLFLLLMLLKPA